MIKKNEGMTFTNLVLKLEVGLVFGPKTASGQLKTRPGSIIDDITQK